LHKRKKLSQHITGKIAGGKIAARAITEKLQRKKKQQDPSQKICRRRRAASRHGRRILQKGGEAMDQFTVVSLHEICTYT
jgi:hypothetical protein